MVYQVRKRGKGMTNEPISKIKSKYLVMDEYGYTDKELVDTVNILVDKVNELITQIHHKAESEVEENVVN